VAIHRADHAQAFLVGEALDLGELAELGARRVGDRAGDRVL
jgi:hypothetical protein